MTVGDFLRKEIELARNQGVREALRSGAGEVGLKALNSLTTPMETPIWRGDWDVCLVLDACRVDVMQQVADDYEFLPETVDSVWSVGSASPEWLGKTFGPRYDQEVRRTGYVTANPFTGKPADALDVLADDVFPLHDRPFAYLDEVWRDQWHGSDNYTVDPSVLTGRARWAWANRDADVMDRLVVHYMQPHLPFRSRKEWFNGWGGVEKFGEPNRQTDKDAWLKVRDGELPRDEFWLAYQDNLRWVLEEVRHWFEYTDAEIVVTSDHGNGFGEFGVWSHPVGCAAPAVRRVPWVRMRGVDRPDGMPAVAGDPPVTEGATHDIDEQLGALGYR